MTVRTKIIRTFAWSFLGVFLPGLANLALSLSETIDWSLAKTTLVSLFFAASAAAVRTVVAFLPILKDDDFGLQRSP